MKVKNKTIVITGAGNGMGQEMTLLLLQKGARVAAIDINENALKETQRKAGHLLGNLSTHVANIADLQVVEQLPQVVLSRHSCIDGLINNAGIIQPFLRLNDLEYKDIHRVMDINFWGTLYMTKTFLPYLLKRPEAHITNISSMGGFLPVPGQSLYGASKAAVKLLTEGLRSELVGTTVGVSIVFPGAIATNISANSGVVNPNISQADLKKFNMMSASKAAEIIIEGMESNAYRVLVGKDASFMDFIYRLNPKMAANYIQRKMKVLLK
jgi:short-subunit dehydrogenase